MAYDQLKLWPLARLKVKYRLISSDLTGSHVEQRVRGNV
jgi:hypothetical protein